MFGDFDPRFFSFDPVDVFDHFEEFRAHEGFDVAVVADAAFVSVGGFAELVGVGDVGEAFFEGLAGFPEGWLVRVGRIENWVSEKGLFNCGRMRKGEGGNSA